MKEGFQTLQVLTEDGRVISGLQKSRTDTQLQLLLADGTLQTIASDAIETVQNGRSLMPAGLVDLLKEQELVDLMRFLIELGKSPKYTVDAAPRVRNWSVLSHSPAAAEKNQSYQSGYGGRRFSGTGLGVGACHGGRSLAGSRIAHVSTLSRLTRDGLCAL